MNLEIVDGKNNAITGLQKLIHAAGRVHEEIGRVIINNLYEKIKNNCIVNMHDVTSVRSENVRSNKR